MPKIKIIVAVLCVWTACSMLSLQTITTPSPYEVRKLGIAKTKVVVSPVLLQEQKVVHCYTGTERNWDKLFQSTMIYIHAKSENFNVYVAGEPKEAVDAFKGSWFNLFAPQRTIDVNPFNKTCIFVDTKDNYSLQVIITEVDQGRMYLMAAGLMVVFASRTLSRKPAFFYLGASILGVITLLVVIVYFIHNHVATKTVSITILVSGWTTFAYFFRQMWIAKVFDDHFVHYVVLTGFISFLVSYRIGPPTNPRSKNVMMWALQGLGVVMIYFSSWLEKASSVVIVVALLINYSVQFLVRLKQRRCKGCPWLSNVEMPRALWAPLQLGWQGALHII